MRYVKESEFVRHEPCPHCGSRDNLGIYTDHEYCFGCGHVRLYQYSYPISKPTETTKTISFPHDVTNMMPIEAAMWLKKYGITPLEVKANMILYSPSKEMLIFPLFEDRKFIAYTGRYFGKDTSHPKWKHIGPIDKVTKLFNQEESKQTGVIFVEDIVSAIKVGRQYGCVPLFRAHINVNKILSLKEKGITKFLIWLDRDKAKESFVMSEHFRKHCLDVKTLLTEQDPKCYTDEQIEKIVEIKLK